jgi:hypothetical protein
MTFEPENELERLLVDAAKSEAGRQPFLRALLEHNLLIIAEGRQPTEPRQEILEQDTEITVRQIEMEGKLYTPIFSSERRISAIVTENVGFLAMRGRELLAMTRGTDLVLNPGSTYGKFLTPTEVESLLDGSIFSPESAQSTDVGAKQILLGQPSIFPRHVTEALSTFFAKHREVDAAYLAHAHIAGDETPHTMIGIATTGDYPALVQAAGPVINPVLKAGEIIDLIQVGQAADPVSDYMLGNTKPFYKRKKWLGLF